MGSSHTLGNGFICLLWSTDSALKPLYTLLCRLWNSDNNPIHEIEQTSIYIKSQNYKAGRKLQNHFPSLSSFTDRDLKIQRLHGTKVLEEIKEGISLGSQRRRVMIQKTAVFYPAYGKTIYIQFNTIITYQYVAASILSIWGIATLDMMMSDFCIKF